MNVMNTFKQLEISYSKISSNFSLFDNYTIQEPSEVINPENENSDVNEFNNKGICSDYQVFERPDSPITESQMSYSISESSYQRAEKEINVIPNQENMKEILLKNENLQKNMNQINSKLNLNSPDNDNLMILNQSFTSKNQEVGDPNNKNPQKKKKKKKFCTCT